MASKSAEEIEASTQKPLRDLKEVLRDGEELLKLGARDLSKRGRAARERLAAAVEIAQQTRHKLEEQLTDSLQATQRAIRHYPYRSIGVAFVAGLVIGLLANRDKSF